MELSWVCSTTTEEQRQRFAAKSRREEPMA